MITFLTMANHGRKSTVSLGLYQRRHGVGGRAQKGKFPEVHCGQFVSLQSLNFMVSSTLIAKLP